MDYPNGHAVVAQENSCKLPFTCAIKVCKWCVLLIIDFLLQQLQNTLEKYSNINVATVSKSFLKAI